MSENSIQIFEHEMFGRIRTLMINDEPYFVGKDVAMVLGYSNPPKAIRDHVDEEDKTVNELFTVNGTRGILINESGVYSLIISSKLQVAKQFKHWVTHDVLPTIRRTGSYSIQSKPDSCMIDDPIQRAERWIEERKEYIALEQKIEKDKPLVEFAEHIQTSDDCISMNDMAKLASKNGIKIGRNRLFAFLRNQKVLKKDNIPYQRYIEAQRWFQVKESVYDTANFTRICLTTMVTPQGQRGIIKMIKKERLLV